MLAVSVGGRCFDFLVLAYHISFLSPSLREMARYTLKYCLKEPLNPRQPARHLTNSHKDIFNESSYRDF